jgi:hypothetical protein
MHCMQPHDGALAGVRLGKPLVLWCMRQFFRQPQGSRCCGFMQPPQMFAHGSRFKTAHNETALFKTRSLFPPLSFSLKQPVQTNRAVGNKKIRQQPLCIRLSLLPGVGTLNDNNLNPYPLFVRVEPAAPRSRVNLQRMDFSTERAPMVLIQEVTILNEIM